MGTADFSWLLFVDDVDQGFVIDPIDLGTGVGGQAGIDEAQSRMEVADDSNRDFVNFGVGVGKADQGRDRFGTDARIGKDAIGQVVDEAAIGNFAKDVQGFAVLL